MILLHDLDAFDRAIREHERLLLFKHSPICPISARAHREWEAFRAAEPEATTAFVDVVGDRAVARGLAEACGVPHESPQAILFVAGAARWDASHGDITQESLVGAWKSGANDGA